MSRIVVVGAGIIGTMHAALARRAGWDVTHLDADAEPRSASVRNFGLIWISGRAPGDELDVALRARELWSDLAADAPGVGLRDDGSLLVVQRTDELAVLEQVVARADAERRGVRLLDADEVRTVNPAVREVLAALHCTSDAVVEPRLALPTLRGALEATDDGSGERYRFLGGRVAIQIEPGQVVDHTGQRHGGDVVVICPGAERRGPIAELVADAPVRRVQLQMMQTEPLGERLTTSLADGDSLRYYPAFDVPALADLAPQAPVAARHHMQLLVSQRAGGELTVGDTHAYDEPFDFAADEAAYDHLHERATSILGRPLPPVVRRWTGVYSQVLDGDICLRREVEPGLWLVTGPGGRGMTLSPAIAEQTLTEIGPCP